MVRKRSVHQERIVLPCSCLGVLGITNQINFSLTDSVEELKWIALSVHAMNAVNVHWDSGALGSLCTTASSNEVTRR